MKDVLWTETARRTLRETSDFILELWDQNVFDNFTDQLDHRIVEIQQNPDIGSTYKSSRIRKLIIHKTVSLFYANTDQYVKLLVIWDNRQDPERLLKKLTDTNDSKST